jgi:hypothetical protein
LARPQASEVNPLAATNVAAGTYTMTATAPSGYQLAACGNTTNTGHDQHLPRVSTSREWGPVVNRALGGCFTAREAREGQQPRFVIGAPGPMIFCPVVMQGVPGSRTLVKDKAACEGGKCRSHVRLI